MKVDPTHLHYDCMSFTEYNSYPTICLDFAQYVVYISGRVQCDKVPGFYTQIALISLILFIPSCNMGVFVVQICSKIQFVEYITVKTL
jgi:hypothetical protein